MVVIRFELTHLHIDMLKHANIIWNKDEYGAAGIDPKRPFGNSSVMEDLRELFPEFPDEILYEVYHQTGIALKIILSRQSFEPGMYELRDKWVKI